MEPVPSLESELFPMHLSDEFSVTQVWVELAEREIKFPLHILQVFEVELNAGWNPSKLTSSEVKFEGQRGKMDSISRLTLKPALFLEPVTPAPPSTELLKVALFTLNWAVRFAVSWLCVRVFKKSVRVYEKFTGLVLVEVVCPVSLLIPVFAV